MNENIDLTKILKDCPIGWKLYSPLCGEVEIYDIKESDDYPIIVSSKMGNKNFSKEGCYYQGVEGAECLLFPSSEQRDWSKFTAPWYKKDKFDPNTLQPFDRVLVRHECYQRWRCEFYSYVYDDNSGCPYVAISGAYKRCIPYNEETKHLVGTSDEAPEYYRYWED